jgi:hypothetical protein
MTTLLPANLFKLRQLAEVPRSVFAAAPTLDDARDEKKRLSFLGMLRRGPTPKTPATAPRPLNAEHTFNAAVWIRFADVPKQAISLVLVFKDQKGEFGVVVDEAPVGASRSIMLSGNVTINVRGDIEYLRACCSGVDSNQRYVIDELYVQRVNTHDAKDSGLRRA